MIVVLENLGLRYNFDWVFQAINLEINSGTRLAISGPNGSGKSSLLKIVCGMLSPSVGSISCSHDGVEIPRQKRFRHFSFAAPYQALEEDWTFSQQFGHQKKVQETHPYFLNKNPIDLLSKEAMKGKRIEDFSSGMKQRARLLLAFAKNSKIVVLDEPLSNLDKQGEQWLKDLIDQSLGERSLIVAGNRSEELALANQKLELKI